MLQIALTKELSPEFLTNNYGVMRLLLYELKWNFLPPVCTLTNPLSRRFVFNPFLRGHTDIMEKCHKWDTVLRAFFHRTQMLHGAFFPFKFTWKGWGGNSSKEIPCGSRPSSAKCINLRTGLHSNQHCPYWFPSTSPDAPGNVQAVCPPSSEMYCA